MIEEMVAQVDDATTEVRQRKVLVRLRFGVHRFANQQVQRANATHVKVEADNRARHVVAP